MTTFYEYDQLDRLVGRIGAEGKTVIQINAVNESDVAVDGEAPIHVKIA